MRWFRFWKTLRFQPADASIDPSDGSHSGCHLRIGTIRGFLKAGLPVYQSTAGRMGVAVLESEPADYESLMDERSSLNDVEELRKWLGGGSVGFSPTKFRRKIRGLQARG
jgi:hypothetical protein